MVIRRPCHESGSVSSVASGTAMSAGRAGVVRTTIAGAFNNLHMIKELLRVAVVTNPGNHYPATLLLAKQIIDGQAVPFFRHCGTGSDHRLHRCLLA